MAFNARRTLTYGLGSLWIVDALLKLQPAMYHAFLISNVLAPAATDSQPAWLYHVMLAGAKWWVHLGILSNIVNFGIELIIGILILWGPDRVMGRTGLWLSCAWGIVLWVFAEGLGGLVSGSPTIIQGSPGSIPFYLVAAVLLLAPKTLWTKENRSRLARWGFGGFWLLGLLWQVLPSSGFWTGPGLAAQFGDVTMNGPEPAWLQMTINALVISAQTHPVLDNAIFSLIMALIAILNFWNPEATITHIVEFAWLLFLWAIPQAFGTLLTGTGTDPGMMWPYALLIVALAWPTQPMSTTKPVSVTAKNAP